MTLAGFLNVALLVTLPRILPGAFRAWSVPVWLLTAAGLAVTYTRGAWVGFAAGAAVLLAMVSRRARLVLLASLVILPVILVLGPRDLSHRFRSMFDPGEAGIKERIYMWRSGVAMWQERPLLGWGPGGVKREYSRYALPEAYKKHTGHVHNTPLQILVERGVLGLVTWVAIWVAFYPGEHPSLPRARREPRAGARPRSGQHRRGDGVPRGGALGAQCRQLRRGDRDRGRHEPPVGGRAESRAAARAGEWLGVTMLYSDAWHHRP